MTQWLARSAAALAIAGAAVMAQEGPARSGWRPVLQLRVLASAPDGTMPLLSKSWTLQSAGAPIAATIVSGSTLCSLAIGGAETPALAGGHDSMWTTSGQFLEERAGVYTINLTSRWVTSPAQPVPASAVTTQTLSLRDGDSVILDLFKSAGGANCGVRSAAIEARVIFEPEESRLPLVRYAADVWWVHAAPGAPERRQHVLANIDGDTVLPLLFDRLGFPLPPFHPRQGTAQAFVHFRGALRVRTRVDGLVDVDIDSFGPIFGLDRPEAPNLRSLPKARKTVTVRVDETQTIDFAPPEGAAGSIAPDPSGPDRELATAPVREAAAAGAAAVGLEVRNGRLALNTATFFKAHRTRILLRLHRLR
jgi:hypothetical protein